MSLRNKIRGLKEIWQFENRLPLLLTRTLFPRENLHVYRYKGFELLTDLRGGDANGAREVLTSSMYRRFLPHMKLEGELNVLDIGANNGGFPLLLAASGLELRKVVSVELNPNTFIRLRFNLERNLNGKAIAVNAAVCGEARRLRLALGEGDSGDSIYTDSDSSDANVFEIDGLTIDEIYDRYFSGETVDICKIDIEGAEFEIFSASSHKRLADCRYLIMEIHEKKDRALSDILPAIEELGFARQPTPSDADPAVHFFVNKRHG